MKLNVVRMIVLPLVVCCAAVQSRSFKRRSQVIGNRKSSPNHQSNSQPVCRKRDGDYFEILAAIEERMCQIRTSPCEFAQPLCDARNRTNSRAKSGDKIDALPMAGPARQNYGMQVAASAYRSSREQVMHDWNVIATINTHRFRSAFKLLEPLGEVRRTSYYNVLSMKVTDIRNFLETLRDWMANYPDTQETLSRVGPVEQTFPFQSLEEFQDRAKELAAVYLPQLAGKSFHVRMHRRGWKGRLETSAEERRIGEFLFEKFAGTEAPARVDFKDPDAILALEILDTRAGLALWRRDDLTRYPFLKLD
jgi:tRNA(Ser,Leu) C12 N-acetylase TAN1